VKVQEATFNVFPFKFHLVWNEEEELIKLKFEFCFDMKPQVLSITSQGVLNLIKNFYQAFLDYWEFKKDFVDIPHKVFATEFQKKVLKELKKLKIGEVLTYKELAKRLGYENAYRAVGQALSKNPLPLIYPCHRIIGTKGLTGYSQGLIIKQFLLYRELNINF